MRWKQKQTQNKSNRNKKERKQRQLIHLERTEANGETNSICGLFSFVCSLACVAHQSVTIIDNNNTLSAYNLTCLIVLLHTTNNYNKQKNVFPFDISYNLACYPLFPFYRVYVSSALFSTTIQLTV